VDQCAKSDWARSARQLHAIDFSILLQQGIARRAEDRVPVNATNAGVLSRRAAACASCAAGKISVQRKCLAAEQNQAYENGKSFHEVVSRNCLFRAQMRTGGYSKSEPNKFNG
jgi:hypothetical protein